MFTFASPRHRVTIGHPSFDLESNLNSTLRVVAVPTVLTPVSCVHVHQPTIACANPGMWRCHVGRGMCDVGCGTRHSTTQSTLSTPFLPCFCSIHDRSATRMDAWRACTASASRAVHHAPARRGCSPPSGMPAEYDHPHSKSGRLALSMPCAQAQCMVARGVVAWLPSTAWSSPNTVRCTAPPSRLTFSVFWPAARSYGCRTRESLLSARSSTAICTRQHLYRQSCPWRSCTPCQ